jgi:hypothetical protein
MTPFSGAPMNRLPHILILILLPLLVLGCDSSDDVGDSIDLGPLRTAFGCTTIGQITLGQTVNGTLAATDCTLPEDGTYVDYYVFQLSSSQNVRIDLESASFDAFLILFSTTRTPIAFDDDGGGGLNSRLTRQLSAGVYVIAANSVEEGETGPYTLRLSAAN